MSDTLVEVADRFTKRMDAIEKEAKDLRSSQLAIAKVNNNRFAQLIEVKGVVMRLRKAMKKGGLVEGEEGEGEVGNEHEEEEHGGDEEKVALLHKGRGRKDKQPKSKTEFEKSYNESLFSLCQFLLFLYGYSGAIAVTGLVWAAIVLFQFELIDWSGESFEVPVLKPDVWFGPALYVGYIVPLSIMFFWINASCEFVRFNAPW